MGLQRCCASDLAGQVDTAVPQFVNQLAESGDDLAAAEASGHRRPNRQRRGAHPARSASVGWRVVVLAAGLATVVALVARGRRRLAVAATSSPAPRVAAFTASPIPPRLAVELVPRTAWDINLRSELHSSEWKRLREIVCEAAGHRCEICGGVGRRAPDCHEVWEYDDIQQIQRLVRLQALCAACHAVKHLGGEDAGGRGEQARVHLAEVNGWTATQTEIYLRAQAEQWIARSAKKWTLDIAALDQYGPALPPSTRKKRPPSARKKPCASCRDRFPPDQLRVDEVGRALCPHCFEVELTEPGFKMWPDHEMPPPGMGGLEE
ncbi:HNH endonuclease [Nocardia fluminea]|uniref:HNH endonuclease n=1 Tax=Nocardia fluminea TaxID=134984 RepID=UPI003666DF2D